MNYFRPHISVLALSILIPGLSFAASLTNLKAEPTNDERSLNISWSPADSETLAESDGYAIQWSDRQSNIHINKPAKLYKAENSIFVRLNSFEPNVNYYFRVYSYQKDGYKKTLANGSKMLKWKRTASNVITTEEITITDPVIVNNTSSSTEATVDWQFGKLRSVPFDTFVDLSWSRPTKMINSDYDGFQIKVSSTADMKDPIKIFTAKRGVITTRLKGLTPNTQYYAEGAFYKELESSRKVFGESPVKAFKTIPAIDRTINNRASRNIKKIEKRSYFTVTVGETETTSTTTTSTETSTTTTTNSGDIKSRIKALKAKIKALQRELLDLEKKAGITHTTTSSTQKTTKKLTLRERLRLKRLNRK